MTMQQQSTELPEVIKPQSGEIVQTSFFNSKDLFEHVQRVAKLFSASDLVPVKYKNNIGNCVIAIEMANRMGASPLMVMQNLDVILGKPAWSSKFLIASLNSCGKFSPLRYESDDKNGGRCRAWANDKETGERCNGAWVTMEMAKAEGWVDKNGSKWKTMPELMLRYRAASFFTNQYAPEVSMGLQSVEEVYDIPYTEVKSKAEPVAIDHEAERLTILLKECKTPADVDVLAMQFPDYDHSIFEGRKNELKK